MKVKIAAVTTAGVFLIVWASLSIYRGRTASTVHAAPAARAGGAGMQDGDSPINIGGGSIYGRLRDAQAGWTIISPKEVYAQSSNLGTLVSQGIENVPGTLQLPKGWVIRLSNRTKATPPKEKPDAVLIYSDSACKGQTLDPNQTICLKTRKDSRWTVRSDGQLRFHDSTCDGTTGDKEDSDCDYLLYVRIESPKSTTKYSGTCNGGKCQIGIGR